ncbi:MAG: hypothetical protein AVDCRST_MAG93-9605, partial [uncultured Chloroflexia bacterium]
MHNQTIDLLIRDAVQGYFETRSECGENQEVSRWQARLVPQQPVEAAPMLPIHKG